MSIGNKGGQPTKYTKEMGDKICNLIATHAMGLNKLIELYKLPNKQTIFNWMQKNDEFFDQYLRARRFQSHVLADDILDLPENIPTFVDKDSIERIDHGMLGRAKLNLESKKWHASKLEPKIYGDQKQMEELQGKNEALLNECRLLREQLDEKNKKDY